MKTFEIAGKTIRNRFVLAPLAGFTDFSLRKMSSDYGAGLIYTEMESAEALLHKSKETFDDLRNTFRDKEECEGSLLALQLFGGNQKSVIQAIPIAEKYASYDFLDFNCGCPVPKVMKQRAGAYWLNRLDELYPLLEKMVNISSKPVIIKIRLGFNEILDIKHVCKKIESCGVSAIAIHGRTRKEGFSGPVHYDIIREVADYISIPVIANGGIDEKNFLSVLDESHASGVMIGQRAIGYPKVFQDMARKEDGLCVVPPTLSSQITDLKKHLRLIFSCKDEKPAADIMRSISVKYLKGFSNSKEIRMKLIHCRSLKEYMYILDSVHIEQKDAHFD